MAAMDKMPSPPGGGSDDASGESPAQRVATAQYEYNQLKQSEPELSDDEAQQQIISKKNLDETEASAFRDWVGGRGELRVPRTGLDDAPDESPPLAKPASRVRRVESTGGAVRDAFTGRKGNFLQYLDGVKAKLTPEQFAEFKEAIEKSEDEEVLLEAVENVRNIVSPKAAPAEQKPDTQSPPKLQTLKERRDELKARVDEARRKATTSGGEAKVDDAPMPASTDDASTPVDQSQVTPEPTPKVRERSRKKQTTASSRKSRQTEDDAVPTEQDVANESERAGKAQKAMEDEKKRMPPPLPKGQDASLSKQIEHVRAMMKAEKESAEPGIGKTFVKWRPETQTLADHMGEPEENWDRKTVPGVTEDQARVLDSTIERTRAKSERREGIWNDSENPVLTPVQAQDLQIRAAEAGRATLASTQEPDAHVGTWQQRFKYERNDWKHWARKLNPFRTRNNDSLREFWEATTRESKEKRVGILPMIFQGRRGTMNAPLELSELTLKGLRENPLRTPDGRRNPEAGRWMALANREVEMQREIYARGYTKFFEGKNFKGVRNAMVIGASAGLIAAAFLSSGILAPVAAGAVGGLTGTHMRNYLRNNEAKGAFVLPILWGGLWSMGTNVAAQSYGLDQVVEEQLKRLTDTPPSEKMPLVEMKPQDPTPLLNFDKVPSYGGEGLKPSVPDVAPQAPSFGTESIINDKSSITTSEIVQKLSPSIQFPAEYTVTAGDSVARHGIDGFMRTGFFDTAYFKQLGLSDLARNQFIEAVRDVFTQNSDLADKFGGRIIQGRDGLDLAFSAGDKLDASVWREPEFLKELGERLRSGNYTVIDSSMRGKGGVQAIIKQLAAIKYT